MSEEKMVKLGTFDENTPRGNSYDATDVNKEKNSILEVEQSKEKAKDK